MRLLDLWDEPLNFLDILSRVQIEDLILKFKPTIIFVEHDCIFAKNSVRRYMIMGTKTWRKLLSYYKSYKKIFLLDLLFSFLSATVVLVIPFIVRYLTDNLISMNSSEAMVIILKSSLFVFVLMIIKFGCDYFVLYYGHLMGSEMEADMRSELFDHYQKMSFSFFDENKSGDLISRITTDLVNTSELLHHLPEELLQIIIRVGGVFIAFFALNIYEGITLLIIFITMSAFLSVFLNKMQKAFIKNHERIADINSQIEDSLLGIKVTKTFTNEDLEIKKFEAGNKRFVESQKYAFKIMGVAYSGLMFFITAILPIVAILGIILVHRNQITNGTLLLFLLAESLIVGPIFSFIEQLQLFQNTMAGFYRFCDFLKIQPEIKESPNAIQLKEVTGNIEFKNVSFKYKSGKQVFKNLNLKINAGEYVALVGPSGVGKSTLCNLTPRFYDVTEGKILIDGNPIKNVTLKSLRQNIGFVSQDIFLFSGSVMENIRYGNLDASEEEVIEATKNAHAHEFICKLEKGYDTYIGERGAKLSGGQKQRIAIARVFLKNPPILIFDEATSSLDNESERLIQKSMEKLAKNRTTIVIAHRLSTVKNAKRILVLDESGISEEGTHEELLNKNGIYAQFYNSQFQKF